MNTFAVLFVAAMVAGEPAHHAAHSEAKAIQHAQEQERKMMEQAMHRQMEAEKQMERAQQRSVHEQMKAQLQAQAHHNLNHSSIQAPVVHHGSTGYAGRPYGSTSHSYYGGGHHSSHRYTGRYQHHRTWPMAKDPELVGLHQLKQSLDNVHVGRSVMPAQKMAIERALMRVVESSRRPSTDSLARLAGHLGSALADRESPTIDTSTIALALRGGLNITHLINAERAEVMTELQTALKHGKVQPHEITSVIDSLKSLEHQELARR